MESANLHHQQHQLQENLGHLGSSSSSSSLATSPSYYGVGIKHAWTQPTTTTTTTTNLSNPSNPSFNSSSSINMVPDLGFHCWPPSSNNLNRAGSSSSIKEELSSSSSDSTFPKFTQMLTSPSTTSINLDDDDYHFPTATSLGLIKNEQKEMMMNDLSEKLLLKTLSSSGINHQISFAGDPHHHQFYSSSNNHVQNFTQLMPARSGGQYFSQIYPSINISNLNQQSSPSSEISSCSSIDMNLQAMDLLASPRFSTHEPSNSHDTLGIYNKQIRHNSFGLQQMHQSRTNHHDHHSLLSCGTSSKLSAFENDITTSDVKRPGNLIEPKATQAAAAKKSRLKSRTPCPPLKVRKEKLGDRIATLQQLVAPFGKTDTASVLMEAIGYIKFLQNQVETLSVPYMKSSRNNPSSKAMLQGGVIAMNGSNGDHDRKRDLRSRGLCLVPLSCMSYVTASTDAATATASGISGSVNWPNPHYGHGVIDLK